MGQGKFVDIHGKRRKRIGIFFFYDADGVADNYIEYLLNGIVDCLDNLVIVSNGELTREAKALFGKFTQRGARNTGKLIIRENTGFDVWAYKAAIDYLGWEELDCCGELILFNHTIMGPIYPFEEVFDKMDSIETDYWGLNVHYGISSDLMGSPYCYIPKHLQSHFLAFRNSVIRSKLFHNYWEKLPQIKSYIDSIGKHESYLTKYFEDNGFRWACYSETDYLSEWTPYPLIDLPIEVLSKCRCPIFKRKSFFCYGNHFLNRGQYAGQGEYLLEWLRDNTSYDVELILDNITRTCNQADYAKNLGLLRLPTIKTPERKHSTAVFINNSNGIIPDEYLTEAELHLDKMGIPIFQNNRHSKQSWENLFTGANSNFNNYEFVCLIYPPNGDDKYRYGLRAQTIRLLNQFLSAEGIMNVERTFEDDDRIAVITGQRPAALWGYLSELWGKTAKAFVKKNAVVDGSKLPVGVGCGVVWLRTSAFPKEIPYDLLDKEKTDLLFGGMFDGVLSILAQLKGGLTVSICTSQELLAEHGSIEDLIESSNARVCDGLRRELNDFRTSTCWRITAPFRWLKDVCVNRNKHISTNSFYEDE